MTSINSERPVTFTVFGDSQQQDDTTVWNRISNMALLERPNFGLIVGDLVDNGGGLSQWRNEFLNNGHNFMKSIPLFTVVGNHDIGNDPNAVNYHKYLKHPGNKNYYTFVYGNIQIFVIDSNDEMEKGSAQYVWLENELAKSKVEWKIIAHHHAPYSSDLDDYGNTEISLPMDGDPNFEPIIPLYEKFNVDMVFYGHIHSYERTFPLLNKQTVNNGGVVYIQCGGAGGNTEISGVIRSWFTAKVKSTHHYCIVSVNKSKLHFSAYDNQGNLFDQYLIDKTKIFKNDITIGSTKLNPPIFQFKSNKFLDKVDITILNYNKKGQIRYTLDGSLPTIKSQLYKSPIQIKKTTTLITVVIDEIGNISKESKQEFQKIIAKNSVDIKPKNNGLKYNYFEGENWVSLPKFQQLDIIKSGVIDNFNIGNIKEQEDQFALTFDGYIQISRTGIYNFSVTSDDGAKLFIDNELVIDNDGSHSARTRSGKIALNKGYHKIYLEYFEDCEGETLSVFYNLNGSNKIQIPDSILFY